MSGRKIFCALVYVLIAFVFAGQNVSAKDEWLAVRSKNFYLVGNASEKEIRATAVKLEQFREIFRRLLPKINFNAPVPTKVIVFKDAAAYNLYKPVREDGKIDSSVAGYFLSNDDINYITLAAGGNSDSAGQSFEIIFHEYTHFLINNNVGNSNVPPWFNEGLAEYYATFKISDDQQSVALGVPHAEYLDLLAESSQQNKLIPFDVFFKTDNYSLNQQTDETSRLFYAQSWALMHYLLNGERKNQTYKFLDFLIDGEKSPKEAFSEAFQADYAAMEKELKKYIAQNSYATTRFELKEKANFDVELQILPLTEADAEATLGDLLYRFKRFDESETHLHRALVLNPNSSQAHVTLGLIKASRGKFDEAEKLLEKAIRLDSNNYLAYFTYAGILSRQGMSEFGFVSEYPLNLAEKMRESLKKAIALNPDFAPSYELYAFVSAVRNENIVQAIDYLNRALKIAPGNQEYLIRMAELLMWKQDFAEAKLIATKIVKTASDARMKVYAENTLERIYNYEGQLLSAKNPRKNRAEITDRILSEEELRELREKGLIESLNMLIAKPQIGEKRVLGFVTRIDCQPQAIFYTVRAGNNTLHLKSDSFETVNLTAYSKEMGNAKFGCGETKQTSPAVIVYRAAEQAENAKIAGVIRSIEFVPTNFKFLN